MLPPETHFLQMFLYQALKASHMFSFIFLCNTRKPHQIGFYPLTVKQRPIISYMKPYIAVIVDITALHIPEKLHVVEEEICR